MAVVSVNEINDGERAVKTRSGWEYTRVFKVVLDDPTDGPRAAALADDGSTAVPSINDAHPDDANALAHRIDPQKVSDTRLIFNVAVDYKTQFGAELPITENPLDEDPTIAWGRWTRTIAVDKDKDGTAVLNSARDPFDPPAEDDEYELEVTITRNEASFTPATAREYLNSVNSSSTTIAGYSADAREAKLVEFGGASAERHGTSYYVVTYKIQFKEDLWDLSLLDQGLYYLDGTHKRRIKLDGEDAEQPQRLNGSGAALDEDAAAAASVFRTFRRRKEKSFASLNLNI